MAEIKKKEKKDRQIVLLTVFAICLVVMGHCDITLDFKELWIFKWIYSFHMPLFFFISGYLLALTTPKAKLSETSYGNFLKKKCIRLLIPFLFINSIIFIIKSALPDRSIMQHPVTLDLNSFLYSTFLSPVGFMWFLPCLFMVFVVIFPLYKLLKLRLDTGMKLFVGIFISIIVLIVLDVTIPEIKFMQLSQAIHYSTYFLLGILYYEFKKPVDKFIMKYWIAIGLIFLIASVSLYFSGYLAAICGIIFSMVFALVLQDKCPDKLVKFSAVTYVVFLLSYFPQMIIRGPIAHRFPDVNQYILSGISFVVGVFLPVAIGVVVLKYKDRNKLLRKMAILIGL